jgi:signal transduction histidine kinase/ActR/RegA family two-component response regulator
MEPVGTRAPLPQPATVEQLSAVLESVNYTVVVLDDAGRISYINQAGERLLSKSRSAVLGGLATQVVPEIFGEAFERYRQSHGLAAAGQFEEYCASLDLWTESHACPSPCGLLVCARDVTARKRNERILTGQARVLEMVATAAPLADILHAITALVEQQSPEDLSSILLLGGGDGRRLHLAAGASLPPDYNAAIEGVEIGPAVGSCGAAAFLGQVVVADDIATDPRWAGFSHIALGHGLRACWSQPIFSPDGRVLGTVANYSRQPRRPTQQSLQLLETAAHLAQIAINQSEADAQRTRTEKLLATEAAVTRVLAAAESADQALPRILDAICTTCDWETGAYWPVDEPAAVLRCGTFWRHSSVKVDEFERVSWQAEFGPGVGLPGRAWEGARPAWIADVREDSNFPRKAIAAAAGLRGALAFPVMLEGRVIGVMEFFASALRPPDKNLDSMLTVIGGQVGQFLHRMSAEQQLKAARDSAEKANRAKDRFLAMLSHELRMPLSPALLIATAMAADQHLPNDVRDDARTIQRNIQLQTRLIDDLLDLSRIENAKLALQVEPLDVHELLRDCVLICDGDAKTKGVDVACDLTARRHGVSGDPFRLRQVVCNLLKNAIKFTPGGGRIVLGTADSADHRVAITVTDTGIGATPEVLLKMFDPFEQGGRARESQGLGLGLTICKGFVEAHGGTIDATSDGPGHGMTITVRLRSIAHTAAPRPGPEHGSAGPRQQRPLSILLVDDHADTLRAMSRLLRRLEHRVITADCVRSALDAAETNDFDLLISDVGLPDGSGTALMKELVKRRPVKGIALTGYGTESDIRQTREAGFFAHLTKPIDFDQLQSAILQGTHAGTVER